MRRILLVLSSASLLLALFLSASPANAQATRTWVSGVGDDANPCSRTAPCKTFAGAVSKTAAGGEISVLDPGGFGSVTITKSITISSEGFEAGVLVSGTNGVNINVASTDNVVLRGLDFEGLGTGLNGVNFIGSGALHVEKCVIHHFIFNGINFAPNASGGRLYVSDTYIRENGTTASTGGVLFKSASAGNITLSNVHIINNSAGVIVDGSSSTAGGVNATIRESVIAGNSNNGISAISTAGHAAANVMADRVAIVSNAGIGINANGAAASGQGSAIVRIGRSTIAANSTGVSITGSGQVKSYGTNQLDGNGTDGSFTLPNLSQM
jgi:hypothetical protein